MERDAPVHATAEHRPADDHVAGRVELHPGLGAAAVPTDDVVRDEAARASGGVADGPSGALDDDARPGGVEGDALDRVAGGDEGRQSVSERQVDLVTTRHDTSRHDTTRHGRDAHAAVGTTSSRTTMRSPARVPMPHERSPVTTSASTVIRAAPSGCPCHRRPCRGTRPPRRSGPRSRRSTTRDLRGSPRPPTPAGVRGRTSRRGSTNRVDVAHRLVASARVVARSVPPGARGDGEDQRAQGQAV